MTTWLCFRKMCVLSGTWHGFNDENPAAPSFTGFHEFSHTFILVLSSLHTFIQFNPIWWSRPCTIVHNHKASKISLLIILFVFSLKSLARCLFFLKQKPMETDTQYFSEVFSDFSRNFPTFWSFQKSSSVFRANYSRVRFIIWKSKRYSSQNETYWFRFRFGFQDSLFHSVWFDECIVFFSLDDGSSLCEKWQRSLYILLIGMQLYLLIHSRSETDDPICSANRLLAIC